MSETEPFEQVEAALDEASERANRLQTDPALSFLFAPPLDVLEEEFLTEEEK